MDLITAALEFFTAVITSQTAFVIFSFLVIGTESIIIYAMSTAMSNKAILQRRKELGMNEVDQCICAIKKNIDQPLFDPCKKQIRGR